MTAPAVALWRAGYRTLVSVIPPGAPLSPGSRITPDQLGKTPGRRNASGTWAGYPYLTYQPTERDVEKWVQDGSNIGLLGEHFPALDIDSMDPWLVEQVRALAFAMLGPGPVRVGRPPKSLVPYRLSGEPFGRMALLLNKDDKSHLVEILGKGKQYLVAGTHPSGSPYKWEGTPLWETDPESLTPISYEQATAFLDALHDLFGMLPGVTVRRLGDGRTDRADVAAQETLKAPSLDALQQAVDLIPNTDDVAPSREDYIRIGYAIRASWPEDEEAAYNVFASWCARHAKDGRVAGNPDTWRGDWRRFGPPYVVGWSWLAELARRFGYNDSATVFERIAPVTDLTMETTEELLSDQAEYSDEWLVDTVIREQGEYLKYVPESGKWYVFDGARWAPDAVRLADQKVRDVHRALSAMLNRAGGSEKEQAKNQAEARRLVKAYTTGSVRSLLQSDSRLTMRADSFDADPWALCTPAGVVDLRTGALAQPSPEQLCSKMTLVAPSDQPHPVWSAYLAYATNGDEDVQRFLQRWAGYCLTGDVSEQKLLIVFGPSQTGKSTWVETMQEIWSDYSQQAPMETFLTSKSDRHPTEIAGLMGSRVVVANETTPGRRFDEVRLKSLTGGDTISARFMHRDFIRFRPQFKLTFVGNYRPDVRDMDSAIQRRLMIVPFVRQVPEAEKDTRLREKLRAEYPSILRWCIEGALAWQREGLNPPPAVVEATQTYFEEQDGVSRFMQEYLTPSDENTPIPAVYSAWRVWANEKGEFVGTERRLVTALVAKGMTRGRGAQGNLLLNAKLKPVPLGV